MHVPAYGSRVWTVRGSGNDWPLGRVVASNIGVAHALARARYGHDVSVYNHEAVCPPHVTPDPLPEVEYFGAGFYSGQP